MSSTEFTEDDGSSREIQLSMTVENIQILNSGGMDGHEVGENEDD